MDSSNKPLNHKEIKKFLMPILRRASFRWKPRAEALSSARIERGLYKCASCENAYRKDEIHMDHVVPVIDLNDGFTTWDQVIFRLFCETQGFQVLCKNCHDVKTAYEDEMRKIRNRLKKEQAKLEKKTKKQNAVGE